MENLERLKLTEECKMPMCHYMGILRKLIKRRAVWTENRTVGENVEIWQQ